MSPPGSVTGLIVQYQKGNHEVAQKLWESYFVQLVELARSSLRGHPQRAADAEDVALSAFDSLFRGIEHGRFPKLSDRDCLWRLLVVITVRKAIDLRKKETCISRGSGKVRAQSELEWKADGDGILAQAIDTAPTPELAAQLAEELERLLARLGDVELRRIALDKLEGFTNSEIAKRLGCAEATVERRVRRIRQELKEG